MYPQSDTNPAMGGERGEKLVSHPPKLIECVKVIDIP